ncbi:MAG: hypothetical protein IJZ68_08695 [Bacteroidaceae bacterium]|nr:hypothetical protein [Bacteroidaceae bacterium]
MNGFALSSLCTVVGIMAGTVTVLSACGIFQYKQNTTSRRNRIISSIALLLLTILIFVSSYLLYPKCPACHEPMNSEYCTSCGSRVTEEYPVCPNCNIEVSTDYCGTCGHKMKEN